MGRPLEHIIFWQPIDSPHQDAFLECVAERFRGEVVLGVERPFPEERAAQGWRVPRHGRVRVLDISIPSNRAALAALASPEALHVFSGFHSHRAVWAGFRRLAPSRARIAIYSEAPEQPPLTGWLKRARGRLLAARWSSRVSFVLAVGGVGRAFFTAIGFPPERIVPFGYYLPPPADAVGAREQGGPFRFISAGQLIRRKGIDLLVDACGSLPRDGWRLDIHGDGPERPSLERLASRRGLSDRIFFHGTATNAEIVRFVAAADCAVLPSRFDGWGMLVNESLSAGTPVICTSRCGAASLPEECGLAAVAPPPVPSAIARGLAGALAAGPPPKAVRARIVAAIRERGSAPAAADRFLAACDGAHRPARGSAAGSAAFAEAVGH